MVLEGVILDGSEMNVACLHTRSPVSVCLCMQIRMHCRLEFIFGCLSAKEERECACVCVSERGR